MPTFDITDNEWRCDICRRCVYWYGTWERSRAIAEVYEGERVSICLDCLDTAKAAISPFTGKKKYKFVGLTTVKGLKEVNLKEI